MAILHTLNKVEPVDNCMTAVNKNDALLLIEDGVYLLLNKKKIEALFQKLYVLKYDADARGIEDKYLEKSILIDMDDFVELTQQYSKTISWY